LLASALYILRIYNQATIDELSDRVHLPGQRALEGEGFADFRNLVAHFLTTNGHELTRMFFIAGKRL
jgi:hypothetical protein